MLQRVQSLMLLGTSILHMVLFFLPVFSWDSGTDASIHITALTNPPFIGLNALIILYSIFIVTQFKARKKQRMYCLVLGFTIAAEILMYTLYMTRYTMTNQYTLVPERSIGIFMLLLSMVLAFWAARRIKKDDDLVKSIDRIR